MQETRDHGLLKQNSVKTDDTWIYYKDNFYKVTSCDDTSITGKLQKTQRLNTKKFIKLPWDKVGVRRLIGDSDAPEEVINVQDIEAKAIVCEGIISSVYPQWVVT